MNSITKRDLMTVAVALTPLAAMLASCAASGAMDPQVLADVQGLEATVSATITAVEQYDTTAISAATESELTNLETAANAALTTLTGATTTTGLTALQTIDTFLNDGLQAVGAALPAASAAFPVLAPFVPMYDAAVALVTAVVEPYINSLIGQITPVAAMRATALKPMKAHFSKTQARAILKIPNMHTSWS